MGDELLSDEEVQNQNIVISSTLTRLKLSRFQTESFSESGDAFRC